MRADHVGPRNGGFPFLALFHALFADTIYSGVFWISDFASVGGLLFGVAQVVFGLVSLGVAVILWRGPSWTYKALLAFYALMFVMVLVYYAFFEVMTLSPGKWVALIAVFWILPGLMTSFVYMRTERSGVAWK